MGAHSPGLDFLKVQFLSSDEVLNEARDLHAQWPDLALDEKRQIIENITDRDVIGKEEITIDLSLPAFQRKKNSNGTQYVIKAPQKGNASSRIIPAMKTNDAGN